MNSCKFIDNKWYFNNKNIFTAIKVVYINGGSGKKTLKIISLRFFKPLISKHIKNFFRRFYKMIFKCSKINKLRNFGFPF